MKKLLKVLGGVVCGSAVLGVISAIIYIFAKDDKENV